MEEQKKYYVYRFKNKEDTIVYVGRTIDLANRFKQHEHLTADVVKIEHIECSSEAEMVWKEIYYINLYYNNKSTNTLDVYTNEKMQDIGLKDKWKEYNYFSNMTSIDDNIEQQYNKYVLNFPQLNYKKLITIVDHKINDIGNNLYALSEKWFKDNPNYVKQLKNNILNYYMNIVKDKDKSKCLWTTYIQYYNDLKGKGYTKCFYYTNKNSNQEHSDKIYLAYLENNFMNNGQLNSLTQDQYALTHLLQFIINSGIKDGKEIIIYIPSSRMRKLLTDWINKQTN